MSLAAIDDLIGHEKALIAALDADDVVAIERATGAFAEALERLRAIGGWRGDGAVPIRAGEAMALAEAARVRVAFLADATRRRLQRIAIATGKGDHANVYGRHGYARAGLPA